MTLTISEIAEAVSGKILCGDPNTIITSVACDSHEVKSGTLFVPIRGSKVDAHKFIPRCLKTCAATLTEYDAPEDAKKPYIKVENTLTALQTLGAYYRSKCDVRVIGVTGSTGKTSTKEMISAALSKGTNVFKTKGNRNSQVGLPLTVLEIAPENDTAVIEMGISYFGEMEKLCDIAKPPMAVITNIGNAHIENFVSRYNTLNEKLKITNSFTKDSVLFLNGDDPMLFNLTGDFEFRTVTFGFEDHFDYYAENVRVEDMSTTFTLRSDTETEEITIPALGEHNIRNALAAYAVARECGLSADIIKEGLAAYQNAPMRQQIFKLPYCTLIDDSYNASPDAMRVSLDVLKSLPATRRIAVLANMLELGEYSEREHLAVGKHVGELGIDCVICIGELARDISKGAMVINSDVTTRCFNDNKSAFEYLTTQMIEGCAILVKGSHSMHTEEISELIKEYDFYNQI